MFKINDLQDYNLFMKFIEAYIHNGFDSIDPYDHFMEATHPSDIQRLNLGRSKIVRQAQDLFIADREYFL